MSNNAAIKKKTHPFRGCVGIRMLVHSIDGDANMPPLNGIITRHESSMLVNQKNIERRLLVEF